MRSILKNMKKSLIKSLSFLAVGVLLLTEATATSKAETLTSIPGPDDQGGMIMPMISLMGTNLTLSFNPSITPLLQSLSTWAPGDTFSPTAAWYDLLDPSAGEGALFNNQYGFMFMANPMMGMDNIPTGKSLAIRLLSDSSDLLQSWNYVKNLNLFDEVFTGSGNQVLWRGNMWHNYFTLPRNVEAGTYTASFQVFIANTTFASGTGFVDYSAPALNATMDTSYNPVTVNYTWEVVPEPSSLLLLACAALGLLVIRKHRFFFK
jgi:hypothetical protein